MIDFEGVKVLVIGDIILDHYIYGKVERISPEAPVPVVNMEKEEYRLGGAGNVINNIFSLGGNPKLVSVIGCDQDGTKLKRVLFRTSRFKSPHFNKRDLEWMSIFSGCNRVTTSKCRVIVNNQQIVRIDSERIEELSEKYRDILEERSIYEIERSDIVVISDYGKGIISESLSQSCIKSCNEMQKIVIIDPKPEHKEFYKGANIITPNLMEARKMVGVYNACSIDLLCKTIQQELMVEFVLITQGKEGMTLLQNNETKYFPTTVREVYDVSGAGDTVVSTLALCLGSGMDLVESAKVANIAAGIVVGKRGTAVVTKEELNSKLRNMEKIN